MNDRPHQLLASFDRGTLRPALLLAANFDSGVGYAWWLMESYWTTIATHYGSSHAVLLAYPSISTVPDNILNAGVAPVLADFSATAVWPSFKQAAFLRKHRVRLLYLSDHAALHWRYLLFRLAGVKKIVVHDHTPGHRRRPTGAKKWLKTIANSAPWVTADAVLATTPFVAQRHREVACVPVRKCYLIPNGIPPLPPESRPIDPHLVFSIPRHRTLIVTTGRAHPIKGISFALLCMRHLIASESRDDVHYLFCGDGPDLPSLRQLTAEFGISDYVTFAGKRSDVAAILPGCQIAFNPSKAEVGYSLAILEYMRAGLPVVVPDNPSVCGATINGRTGLIHREGDVDDACLALKRLLADPSLARELGANARDVVRTTYTLERAQRALTQVLDVVYPRT